MSQSYASLTQKQKKKKKKKKEKKRKEKKLDKLLALCFESTSFDILTHNKVRLGELYQL